jgi:DNA invertase Pin-like site-specific DNA recombinase
MAKGRKVTFDHAAALEMLRQPNQNYSSVATAFGVSRQTIKNIAKDTNVVSNKSYDYRRQLHIDIIEEAKKEQLSPGELADKFEVNVQVVYLALNEGNIVPSDLSKKVAIQKLMPLLKRVASGESIRSVANADQNLMAKLYRAWGDLQRNPNLTEEQNAYYQKS